MADGKFSKPHDIDPLHAAFGSIPVAELMPAYSEIPEEFKRFVNGGHWNRLQSQYMRFTTEDSAKAWLAGASKSLDHAAYTYTVFRMS